MSPRAAAVVWAACAGRLKNRRASRRPCDGRRCARRVVSVAGAGRRASSGCSSRWRHRTASCNHAIPSSGRRRVAEGELVIGSQSRSTLSSSRRGRKRNARRSPSPTPRVRRDSNVPGRRHRAVAADAGAAADSVHACTRRGLKTAPVSRERTWRTQRGGCRTFRRTPDVARSTTTTGSRQGVCGQLSRQAAGVIGSRAAPVGPRSGLPRRCPRCRLTAVRPVTSGRALSVRPSRTVRASGNDGTCG